MEIDTLKQAARGRWAGILGELASMPREILDGKHHPCPKCGGKDRFRAFGDFSETGGVLCNQCHREKNADGIATLQWLLECPFSEAVAKLAEYLGMQVELSGKAASSPSELATHYREAAVYRYEDESGQPLFEVVRYEAKPESAAQWQRKTFRQRVSADNWATKNVRRVPYRLPRLLAASKEMPIFFVEGEKDVERLEEMSFVATTVPGGAGKWRSDWAHYFQDRHVVLLPDNDQKGREHMEAIAEDLLPITQSLRLVELAPLPEKGDVSDWLSAGGTREALIDRCFRTRPMEKQKPRFEIWNADDLLAAEFETRYLIEGVLIAEQPCILAGPKKCLKTSILVDLAVSLVVGTSFLGEFSSRGNQRVLMMSGESGFPTLQDTLRRVTDAARIDPELVRNLFICDDIPRLIEADDMTALRKVLQEREPSVVLFDPAYLMINGEEAGNLFKMGDQLRRLSQTVLEVGATPVLAHHMKKGRIDPYEPPELDQMSWSGFSEYARQWMLLGRRERYQPGSGWHQLWFSVGGSAGHNGLWGLNISEGLFQQRTWEVTVIDAETLDRQKREQRKIRQSEAEEEKLDFIQDRIRDLLLERPQGETGHALRRKIGTSEPFFQMAIGSLCENGEIEFCEVTKANRKKPYDGYRLTCSISSGI